MCFLISNCLVTSYIEIVVSTVVNALEANQVWFEAYFQNNDCEGISTQL